MKFIIFAILFAGACVALPADPADPATNTADGVANAANGVPNAAGVVCKNVTTALNKTVTELDGLIGNLLLPTVRKYNSTVENQLQN